jgi:hypothetical protein
LALAVHVSGDVLATGIPNFDRILDGVGIFSPIETRPTSSHVGSSTERRRAKRAPREVES